MFKNMRVACSIIFILGLTIHENFCSPVLPDTSASQNKTQNYLTGKVLTPRFVNGTEPSRHEFPSIVFIQVDVWQGTDFSFCTGTILDETSVITTPLLCQQGDPSKVSIVAGEHSVENQEGPEQWRTATQILFEPNTPIEGIPEHVGIIILKVNPPFEFNDQVGAAILPPADYQAKGEYTMVGFGQFVGEPGFFNQIINKIQVSIVDNAQCQDQVDVVLCGAVSSCDWDQGGPLFSIDGQGVHTLIGVAQGHYDLGDCDTRPMTKFAYIPKFIDWIQSQLAPARASHDHM